jgi:hypothetical protein
MSTSLSPSTSMRNEDAIKVLRKMKYHYIQDMETLSHEEIEEFTLASPPRKMSTYAPLVYVIPNNDDD